MEDRPRAWRPPTYSAEQRAEVITTALTDPKTLGLPFGCWTQDRLQAYLNEQKRFDVNRSCIDEILLTEGLLWRHQEPWFCERIDPTVAEKGIIEALYTSPPEGLVVICLDEMVPQPARSCPSRQPIRLLPKAQGERLPSCPARHAECRLRPSRLRLLLRFLRPGHRRGADPALPQPVGSQLRWGSVASRGVGAGGRVYAIVDDLQVYRATDVLPFALAYPRWEHVLQPKYASLPEPDRAVV